MFANIINSLKDSYHTIYKDDKLQKLINELETEQKYTKEFLRNHDPYSEYYCTLRHDKCASCGLMVWSKDKDHRYITANDAHLQKIYGIDYCQLESIVGKTDKELAQKWSDINGEKEHTYIHDTFSTDDYIKETGQPARFLKFGYRNGKVFMLDIFKKPLLSDSGEFLGSVGNALDISNRESDIVDLLQYYMSIGIAKRLDKSKSKDVATYLFKNIQKKFNRDFPK
jgi:hypothetical protein